MKTLLLLVFSVSIIFCNAQTQLTNMPASDGYVYAIARYGNTIYIGGNFDTIGGQPRNNLAAFDATTGVLTPFSATFDQRVSSLTIVGNKLIVGGTFFLVNGVNHQGVCMFDLPSNTLNSWNADGRFQSYGIGVQGNVIYYSKDTPSGNGQLTAYDVSTGTYTGWTSDSIFTGDIQTVLVYGNYVYMGGDFGYLGSTTYRDLCRFSLATGALDLTWDPQPTTSNFDILQIIEHKGNIYVGGTYLAIDGQTRPGVASFDASGTLTSFNPNNSSQQIHALASSGDNIFIGGNSYLMGGQTRYRIAEINPANSQATCWSVANVSNAWSVVVGIYVSNDTVYAGCDDGFFVFKGSPQPFIPGGISCPSAVTVSQVAQYTVPLVAGHNYSWIINGGTGSSTSNTISVTWGSGPAGTVSVVETNPATANCQSDTVVLPVAIGISGVIENDVMIAKLYPVPVTDKLFIEMQHSGKCTIAISSSIGTLIQKTNVEEQSSNLDLSKYSPGIYMLSIKQDNHTFFKKIVKL